MAVRFSCSQCSYVYEIETMWLPIRGTPGAPVHAVHGAFGEIRWQMCPGSAKRGAAMA